jgi:hypothetical protein
MSYKDGVTAYKIKNIIWRITDKKYLTGINKEVHRYLVTPATLVLGMS